MKAFGFWQGIACLVVIAAGWVPSISWTAAFWEFRLSQFGDAPPRIESIAAGSPAERAGLRAGDRFLDPRSFDAVNEAIHQVRAGQTLDWELERDGVAIPFKLAGVTPAIAAIWYSSPWFPVAGLLGVVLGLLLIATAPLRPVPYWRSGLVGAFGITLAIGFVVAWFFQNPFTRVRVYQQWLMGTGPDWTWGQTWWGLAAAVSLVLLATLEIRYHLKKR